MVDERDIIETVRDSVFKYGMIENGDRVVVAVSGGSDSVCLLDIMVRLSEELNIQLIVAHFNHGLRENEDELETQFVEKIAGLYALPFVTEKALSLTGDMSSLEEKARDARYEFLEKTRSDNNARRIALGHTMNDQAETVLMRLLRGSGPSGLSGIPPVREVVIIRPLIEVKREDIIEYLSSKGLDYVLDSSNSNQTYLRNRIRLELLPLMMEYQPRIIENLGRLSNVLRDEDNVLDSQTEEWAKGNVLIESEDRVSVNLAEFNSLPSPFKHRLIRSILKRLQKNLRRIDYKHIIYASHLAKSSKPQAFIDLPNNIAVKKIYDRLIFLLKHGDSSSGYCYSVKGAGKTFLKETGQTISVEEIEWDISAELFKDTDRSIAYLDAQEINYPFTIRNIRQGDRFVPLGMKGHRKVKDYFIDLKLSSEERSAVPIIVKDEKIAWICGHRIDDRFKVTPRTKKVLKITCTPSTPSI
jgi:tRNA(Ile)-lysidine synthase